MIEKPKQLGMFQDNFQVSFLIVYTFKLNFNTLVCACL